MLFGVHCISFHRLAYFFLKIIMIMAIIIITINNCWHRYIYIYIHLCQQLFIYIYSVDSEFAAEGKVPGGSTIEPM